MKELDRSFDVAVLLCDGGVRAWRDMWFDWCIRWLNGIDRSKGQLHCLVLHVAAPLTGGHVEKLIKDIRCGYSHCDRNDSNTATSTTLLVKTTSWTLPTLYYYWQQSSFAISCIFFGFCANRSGHQKDVIDACTKVWEEANEILIQKKGGG